MGICKTMKKNYLLALVVWGLTATFGWAINSGDLDPNNDDIDLMFSGYTEFMRYDRSPDERLNVFLRPGERFMFGMNFFTLGRGGKEDVPGDMYVRIKDSQGNVVFGPERLNPGDKGHIPDRNSAITGPDEFSPGGYDALEFLATYADTFHLEVNYEDPNTYNSDIPRDAERFGTDFFDFRVMDPTNTELEGRIWANAWQIMAVEGPSIPFDSQQFVYSDDGVVTKVDYNGMRPWAYVAVANDHGIGPDNHANSHKSFSAWGNIEDLEGEVKAKALMDSLQPQYKLFFDTPDPDVFPPADLDQLFGTLTKDPTVSGCPGEYEINLSVSKSLKGFIFLDLNEVDGYQENSEDIMLDLDFDAGDNVVLWNGLDNLGNPVSRASIDIIVNFKAGITHFPMYDVETNDYGIKVTFISPDGVNGQGAKIYYDDSEISGGNVVDPSNSTGCEGACHTWGYDEGNEIVYNSYWYLENPPIGRVLNFERYEMEAGEDVDLCMGEKPSLEASAGFDDYSWTPAELFEDPTIFNPVLNVTEDAWVFVEGNKDGCTYRDSLFVTVNEITLDINVSPQEICAGEETTLTASGGDTYEWSGGLGSGSQKTVNPSVTTTYTVKGTEASGCQDVQEVEVTVHPLPVVSGGADQSICAGEEVTLTAIGADTYEWTGGISNGIPFSPSSTGTYIVTGITEHGCEAIDEVSVEVFEQPVPSLDDPLAVCAGEGQTIGAVVDANGVGTVRYIWQERTFGGSWVSNANATSSLTISSASETKDYRVELINTLNENCRAYSNEVSLEVNPMPNLAVGPDRQLCDGESVTLEATGADIYTWTGGVENGVAFAPTTTGAYTVKGETLKGCEEEKTVNIEVFDQPAPSLDEPLAVCAGEGQTIGAVVDANGVGTVRYVWQERTSGGSWVANTNATSSLTIASASETKDYRVELINTLNENCRAYSNEVSLEVNPMPNLAVGPDRQLCMGESVTLEATGADTYVWTGGIENGVPFVPTTSWDYTVNGSTLKGCVEEKTVSIEVFEQPAPSIPGAFEICQGGNVTIDGPYDSNHVATVEYHWQQWDGSSWKSVGNMAGAFTIQEAQEDTKVRVELINTENPACRAYSNESEVSVHAVMVENFASEVDILLEEPITVWAEYVGDSLVWQISYGNGLPLFKSSLPEFIDVPEYDAVYQSIVLTNICTDSDFVFVNVRRPVTIPNGFTPNGDDKNETWVIKNIEDYPECKIQIFNRWGTVVRTFYGYDNLWDGTLEGNPLPTATYYYVVDLNFRDFKYAGSVAIIR